MFPRLCVAILALAIWNNSAVSQQENDDAVQAAMAKRFLAIVERNPQRGTALDKVFDHHLQMGTLDAFIGELEQRTKLDASDGTAWMLLGLFESHRRMDAQAIVAFAEAEKIRTKDALPAYYRGQSLLRIGEPSQAVAAFEIAIDRKPTRIILLELFEQLGRTHLRQKRSDLAIEAWTRLESLFSDDLHVLEQIASIQNREGDFANALPRYERLTSMAKDATQRTQFRIAAAQLRIQLGASTQGMAELESILAELKPDGWLYRDVQRKIENVFLKASNQAGLIEYYEKRLAKVPDDIESMVRLCKFLVSSGRISDANEWIVQAIARAPSRLDLRKTHIDQLVADKQFAVACDQYEQLSQLDPKNADTLRDWGKTVLLDPNRKIEDARVEASRIWRKILVGREGQALAFIQVADLLLSARMPNDAQSFFEQAIELAPEEAQFRENYGQFLFDQNQREKAFDAWDAIAEGERRNAASVMRLAEIYDHVQQKDQAVVLASEACRLAPYDATACVKTSRFQRKAGLIDDALQSLANAERLADSNDQRENILLDRLAILEASDRLKSETDALQMQLQQDSNPSLAQLQLLARYLARQKRWKEASSAVSQSLKLDEGNLTMLLVSAEVAEGLGNSEQSIKSLRKLADVDRRKRADYLERITRQQLRQRKFVEAIKTAQEVVQAAPAKVESYEFLSQVCFQAKKPDLGIESLRKALRMDPDSIRLTMTLAQSLASNKNESEAIELYWQLFTTADSLDEKIDLSLKLSKVIQQKNGSQKLPGSSATLSSLIDRMETLRKDPSQFRDTTICLAQVYQSVSDFANAKRTLEALLTDQTRDSAILSQVAKLCVASGDLELAINYQRQLVDVAPEPENESYLANLLRQRGDLDAADAIVVRLLQKEPDQATAIKSIDGLLQRGDCELVLQVLEPLLRKSPDNWELLYRRGMAHAGIDQWAESRATWEEILALGVERGELGLRPAFQENKNGSKKAEAAVSSLVSSDPKALDLEILDLTNKPELADIAQGRVRFPADLTRSRVSPTWSPQNFGELRIATIAWLVHCDTKDNNGKSDWLHRALAQAVGSATRFELIDAMALAKFRQDSDAQLRMAAALAESGEPEMQQYFLELVRSRQVTGVAAENRNQNPLSDPQIELMLEAFESTNEERTNVQSASRTSVRSITQMSANMQMQMAIQSMQSLPQSNMSFGPQFQTNATFFGGPRIVPPPRSAGPVYFSPNSTTGPVVYSLQPGFTNVQPVSSSSTSTSNHHNEGFVRTVVNELRFAGQPDRAEAFLVSQCEDAITEFKLVSLCEYLLSVQRYQEIERPLLRWFGLQPSPKFDSPTEFSVRLLEALGQQATPETAVRLLDSALDASNQRYLKRMLQPLNPSSLTSVIAPQPKVSTQVQAWCKNFVSEEEQCLLQMTQALFGQTNRLDDWLSILQDRVKRSDSKLQPLERIRLALSTVERHAPASLDSILLEALEAIGREPEYALQAAQALLLRKNFEVARRVADASKPANAQESLVRELVMLHASVALQDKDRTEAAIENLVSNTLDSATLQSIALPLQLASSLGIRIAAKLLRPQTNRPQATRSQTPTPTPFVVPQLGMPTPSKETVRFNEMNKYVREGMDVEAIKIARQIISNPRTYPRQGNLNMGAGFYSSGPSLQVIRTPFRQGNTPDPRETARAAAFKVLAGFRDLQKLIDETELRAQASPNSFVLHEQLSEYYELAGDWANMERTTLQALQIRPGASPLRVHYANALLKAGKRGEACDQFIALLNRDANCGLLMLNELLNPFALSNRTDDLLKAVQMAHFQAVVHREELMVVALSIIEDPRGRDIGGVVIEKLVKFDPQLRQQSLTYLYGYEVRNYPRLFDFVIDAVIPKEYEAIRSPWFGLQDHEVYIPSGETLFEILLMCNRQAELESKLAPAIRAAVDRMPNWTGGKVMLAMIAARLNDTAEAKKRFAELATTSRVTAGCPEGVAWRLTKEFMELPEARKTAIRLATSLLGSRRFANNPPEMQPNLLLAKLWIADGEREKAVEMLTQEYDTGSAALTAYGSKALPVERRSSSTPVPSLADIILKAGLPVESYRLFEKHTDEHVRTVNQMLQNIGNITTREAGRQAAISHLEALPPNQAVSEILRDRSNATRNYPALELMFQVPMSSETWSRGIESAVQKTLIRHANDGLLPEIELGLQKLAAAHPTDLSILATQARIRIATGTGDAEIVLRDIDKICSVYDPEIEKLATIAKSQASALQLPSFARNILPTWLVAMQCCEAGQHLAIADRITARAVKVANLMDTVGLTHSELHLANIMLLEWGRVHMQNGRKENGIVIWKSLIRDLEGSSDLAKKWTQNQFDWLMRVAVLAIDVGQVELSHDIALTISKRGGPAPSPPESMRKPSSGFSYQFDTQSALKPSVKAVSALLRKWGDKNSPPEVCFELLVPLVFPNDDEIFLHADLTRPLHLLHDEPTNLASKLVDNAARANRLDDLVSMIDQRSTGVTGLVMRTQIAIARKDFDEAKSLMLKLQQDYQSKKSFDALATSCQIAIPAFRSSELREAAYPILRDLIAREKESGNHPEASFRLFPLVREVDEYLRAGVKEKIELSEK